MKHIKKLVSMTGTLFLGIHLLSQSDKPTATEGKQYSFSEKHNSLPFSLELSLDVLGLELKHYKDKFEKNGFNDIHAQVIIEEAEILVQTAAPALQNILKARIIGLFEKNGLTIQFIANNKITEALNPIITPLETDESHDDDEELEIKKERAKQKKAKLLKPHKHKATKAKQIFAPKRIHGARRTMRRLKKEREEKQKRAYDELVARIESKKAAVMAAKRKNLTQINRIKEETMLQRSKLQKEMIKKSKNDFNHTPFDQNEDKRTGDL